MNTSIPFYHNTPDNTHCFQACIKMLAKYYWSKENYSWEKLDKFTAKVKDLWTWPMAGVLWMQKKGVEVIRVMGEMGDLWAIGGISRNLLELN